jgi:peptidoglycan/LPS O-acetylase OafA/YrhL
LLKKIDFINTLRGYAILGVILVHVSQFIPIPKMLFMITDRGQMGVQLFFMVSAFTLFYSLENRKEEVHPNINFYLRRFFRIAPLYYTATLAYYFYLDKIYIADFTSSNSARNLVAHIFFLNGFDKVYMNTLTPGSWSIAVEMMFYVFVPVLYAFIKNLRSGLIFFFAISSIDIALNLSFFTQGDWFHYFWLVNQLPVFSLGIVLYLFIKNNFFANYIF